MGARRLHALGLALLCGAPIPSCACAQSAGNPVGPDAGLGTAQTPSPAGAPAPIATGTAPGGQALTDSGEIIVTAQRRSERLRDVPISITAIDRDTLVKSGITSTIDIQRVTPGVQLPLYGGFLQPSIRGISSAGAGLGDSSNVAVYVDGVYQPSESAQLLDLPDIQQVEVLKGPQGTLYGQNAAGGAIILTSVTPSFTLGGRLSASYGNHDDKAVRGYVTGPIADDKVAFSIAAGYEDRDGFRRDIARGGHDRGLHSELVRGRLLVKPSESSQLILGAYYSRRSDGGAYSGLPVGPGTALGYALAGLVGLPIPKATDPQSFALNVDPLTRIRNYGFNLLGKLDTGIGTFSTVTAYSNIKVHDIADADYTAVNLGAVDLHIANHNFIQELNFTSPKFSGVTVSAGLFFLALKESYDPSSFAGYFTALGDPVTAYPTNPTPLFATSDYGFNRKRSYAAYAEVGYDVTPRLNLTAGGRYSYETQRTADTHPDILGPAAGPLIPDPRGTVHFQRFTPRATIRYAITGTSNVYASYSQGFKSGYVNVGDNPFVTPLTPPVKPEKVTAYEVGYKGRVARGISVNVAAFTYDYKDLQVFTYSPPNQYYRNAASARIKGIDGDITLDLARGLSLRGGVAFLDAHYRKFPDAVGYTPNAFGFGYDVIAVDVGHRRLQRAPEWTANAALDYEVAVRGGKAGLYVSGNYNSGLNYDPAGTVRQGRYATLDAELSFSPDALKGVRLVAFGRNLTDRSYLSSVLETQFVLGGSYADPRTYGVRAEFAF